MYVYVSQGKNEPHFNENISATAFINSCQHLPNIYAKDLNKNFKGIHVLIRLRIVLGGLLFYSSFFILPALQWLFQKTKQKSKNWRNTSFFGKPPELSRYVTLPLAIPEKTRLLLDISVM